MTSTEAASRRAAAGGRDPAPAAAGGADLQPATPAAPPGSAQFSDPAVGLHRMGRWLEVAVYVAGGFFLIAAAVIVLADAVTGLWSGGGASARALSLLDRVLLVFVLVEVFHTVRLAIWSHEIRAEPFLIVVIIAGVRRILVVTAGSEPIGSRDTLVELGLLVVLLVAASSALHLLRPRGTGV